MGKCSRQNHDILINIFSLNHLNLIFSFHFGIKIAFYRILFLKIKIIVILNLKYLFKKVKKLELNALKEWTSLVAKIPKMLIYANYSLQYTLIYNKNHIET